MQLRVGEFYRMADGTVVGPMRTRTSTNPHLCGVVHGPFIAPDGVRHEVPGDQSAWNFANDGRLDWWNLAERDLATCHLVARFLPRLEAGRRFRTRDGAEVRLESRLDGMAPLTAPVTHDPGNYNQWGHASYAREPVGLAANYAPGSNMNAPRGPSPADLVAEILNDGTEVPLPETWDPYREEAAAISDTPRWGILYEGGRYHTATGEDVIFTSRSGQHPRLQRDRDGEWFTRIPPGVYMCAGCGQTHGNPAFTHELAQDGSMRALAPTWEAHRAETLRREGDADDPADVSMTYIGRLERPTTFNPGPEPEIATAFAADLASDYADLFQRSSPTPVRSMSSTIRAAVARTNVARPTEGKFFRTVHTSPVVRNFVTQADEWFAAGCTGLAPTDMFFGVELETQESPFENEEGEDDEGFARVDGWNVGQDNTVSGAEYRFNGKAAWDKAVNRIQRVFELDHRIDDRCSFHIHTSLAGVVHRYGERFQRRLMGALLSRIKDIPTGVLRRWSNSDWMYEYFEFKVEDDKYIAISHRDHLGTWEFRAFGNVATERDGIRCMELAVWCMAAAYSSMIIPEWDGEDNEAVEELVARELARRDRATARGVA